MMALTLPVATLAIALCSGCATKVEPEAAGSPLYIPLVPTGIYQHRSPCTNYENLQKSLKWGGERLMLSAIGKNQQDIYEVWVDEENEDWTLILHTSGDKQGCVVGSGVGLIMNSSPSNEVSY